MPLHRLTSTSRGSGTVTIPKGDLERDGLVSEDGEVESRPVAVDRVDEREYRIRVIDEDDDST